MHIVLTGSVAFDYLMTFPGYFRDHFLTDKLDSISLSFLVDKMSVQRGGNAPNIAYSLALLGERPRLMATVGEDFGEYRLWLESKGIDTSAVQVIPGEHTASFFANTDRDNCQIASFYPGAMAYASELSFETLPEPKPDLVLISPNDPAAMERYVAECPRLGIPYFYDPSQQIVRMDADTLRTGILSAKALFLNDYEFGLVKKMTGMGQPEILQCAEFLVVTCGQKGSDIYARSGKTHVPIVPAEKVADPTGVGDAFRGGFLVGYAHAWPLELCAQMGALSATYCLEQVGPQGQAYTPAEFVARFRRHFNDFGKLDTLIR
jgi:adenosine kinase